MSHPKRALGAGAVVLVSLLVAANAWAQDPFGPGMQPMQQAPPTKSGSAPAKPPPGAPELHAASGAGDTLVPPGSEPSLPADPTHIKKKVKKRIGTDVQLDEEEQGRAPTTVRKFYGPYYEEESGGYRLRIAFPVWAERKMPALTDPTKTDRASLFGGLYYNRRSPTHADDVLFPLFWNLRNPAEGSRTTILGPFVNRVAPGERDNWLAPLYFTGKRKHGGYTLIPPLLTYTHTDAKGGFNLVGPMFCSWKGGEHCDARTADDIDFGIAPLYFYGQNEQTKYEVIPPLLHYYRYDDKDLSWTNIWGPYYREHTQKRDMFHLLPLYWSIWGKNERHTTVLPFFHYGWHDKAWLFVNPLFLLGHGQHGESTFVTWGYARYRGRTQLDMITPFYWHYRDPDIGLDEQLLFPFLYSRTSPRESNQAFFPFWGHFERYGISETTWITPFFRHSHDLRGWETDINPIRLPRSQRQQLAHRHRAVLLGLRRPRVALHGGLPRVLALQRSPRGQPARRQRLLPLEAAERRPRLGDPHLPRVLLRRDARRPLVERALRSGRLYAPRRPREDANALDPDQALRPRQLTRDPRGGYAGPARNPAARRCGLATSLPGGTPLDVGTTPLRAVACGTRSGSAQDKAVSCRGGRHEIGLCIGEGRLVPWRAARDRALHRRRASRGVVPLRRGNARRSAGFRAGPAIPRSRRQAFAPPDAGCMTEP